MQNLVVKVSGVMSLWPGWEKKETEVQFKMIEIKTILYTDFDYIRFPVWAQLVIFLRDFNHASHIWLWRTAGLLMQVLIKEMILSILLDWIIVEFLHFLKWTNI